MESIFLQHVVKETSRVIRGTDHAGFHTVNQYSVIKELGAGSFGVVKLVQLNETQENYAMKMYGKAQLKKQKEYMRNEVDGNMAIKDAYQDVIREIEIMKELDHICLIRLHEVIDEVEGDKLYLVIDYAKYGQIMNWDSDTLRFTPCFRGKTFFTEKDIQKIMRDCIRALDYMHKKGILHRDIKPQNIMMDENGIAKIGDFGSSERFYNGDDTLQTTIGTYQFFSPECCDPEVKTFSGKANDVWALGVTMYSMIYNQLPFWAETELGVLEQIHQSDLKLLDSREISPGLKNLLLRMMDKSPATRATLSELKKDKWLNEGFAVSLDSREADFIANFTEEELVSKGVPLAAILFAKTLAKKWLKQDGQRSSVTVEQQQKISLIKSLAPSAVPKEQPHSRQIEEFKSAQKQTEKSV